MKNIRVIHFEIHAFDPEKTIKFYSDVFGWKIEEWKFPDDTKIERENRYWGIMTAPENSKDPGINGGIVVRKGPVPKEGEAINAFVCTIGVDSVDNYLEKIEKAGGSIALPKMPIPGMAWLAYAKDIDGNIFGIFEEDKNAK
ncbi:MAG: VOC family protein [Candidatus Pacebacteria bacterium]|nr:VOC family protein [Candidatus Paceibacterota bacterium]